MFTMLTSVLLGVISSIKTNSQGSLVSILVNTGSQGPPSSRIILYVVDRDVLFFYDFETLGQYVRIVFFLIL
jgi:hypothetical protein